MTLLSIIGDDISRIIPLLYAYKDEIKQHVLLCDDDPANYARAKTLQKGMQKFSANNALGWYTKIISINEDSAEEIRNAAQKQFEMPGELWLNATDGYPAMTILLSDLVRKEGGKILSYDHFDNDLHIITSDGSMQTEQLPSSMDINSYLTMLHYKITSSKSAKALHSRKEAILALYKHESNYKKVRELLIYPDTSRYSREMLADTLDILAKLGVVDENHRFDMSKKKALEGDLLEEYIFWLCEALNPDDILLSVEIDFEPGVQNEELTRHVNNELDILLMHKNRLYVIECKNRKNFEGLDAVFKYDSIMDYFGEASKSIIVNISNQRKEVYLGMKKSKNFGYSTLRRAKNSDIGIYHETQINVIKFQNLVRNFFHIA